MLGNYLNNSFHEANESNNSLNHHNHRKINNNRSILFVDEDITEQPPKLSSYSIAALHDKTTRPSSSTASTTVTGIYEKDFPEQLRSTKLRNKLSEHLRHANINNNKNNSQEIPTKDHSPSNDIPYQRNNWSTTDHSLEHLLDKTPSQNNFDLKGSDLSHRGSSISPNGSQSLYNPRRRRFGQLLGRAQRASEKDHQNDNHNHTPAIHLERFSPDLKLSNKFGLDPVPTGAALQESPEIFSKLENPSGNYNRISSGPIENRYRMDLDDDNNDKVDDRKSDHPSIPHDSQESRDINPQKYSFPNIIQSMQPRRAYDDKENYQRQHQFEKQTREKRPLVEVPINQLNQPESDVFRKPKLPRLVSNSKSPSQPQQPQPPRPVQPRPQVQDIHLLSARHSTVSEPQSEDISRNKNLITINGKQYEKRDIIGTGGSSKVYAIRDLSSKRNYAMKKVSIDQYDKTCADKFKAEISLLLRLQKSERIVRLIDYCITENSIYLIMEKGDGDLALALHHRLNMKSPPDMCFIKFHAREILLCLKEVHDADIVHSDLKPANFLMVKGILKLIDFGIADAVPDHTVNIYRESQIGTPNYMAPETLTVNQPGVHAKETWKVGKPSDIWSVGCIIYQMIYGKAPYASYSGHQRILAITNPEIKIKFPERGLGGIRVPQSAISLVQNCLAHLPSDRWNVDECLNCDFFKSKGVSENFVRDVLNQSINYGYNKRMNSDPMSVEDIDGLVNDILNGIQDLNYT